MTNWQLAGSLLSSPRRFFAQLQDHPRYALPFWLALVTALGLTVWYYGIVDLDWLKEQQLSANPRSAQLSEEQRAAAARFLTRGVMLGFAVGGVVLVSVLTRLVEAAYFRFVGAAVGVKRTFRQWFAFSAWTALPHVLATVPAMLILLFASSTQISPGAIQPLSFNELFFHRPMGAPGYNVLSVLGVMHLVTLGLAAYGVKCWSNRSWVFSAVLVLAPAVIFGLLFGVLAK